MRNENINIMGLIIDLLHSCHSSVRMVNIFNCEKRRDHGKKSYERRVHESVVDRSLSQPVSLKPTKK